jgi:hypothetical protein
MEEDRSQESKAFIETYKSEKREVLNSAILTLLNDLPQDRRNTIIENGTPEEVVDYCKGIYDNEFDLNVKILGVSGANEIAWQEALAIFYEEPDIE